MDWKQEIHMNFLKKIENVLGIKTCPINWPIGSGKRFKGVYDRDTKKISMFKAVSVGGFKKCCGNNIMSWNNET